MQLDRERQPPELVVTRKRVAHTCFSLLKTWYETFAKKSGSAAHGVSVSSQNASSSSGRELEEGIAAWDPPLRRAALGD
jgi:hypothetical protein